MLDDKTVDITTQTPIIFEFKHVEQGKWFIGYSAVKKCEAEKN